MYTIGEFARIVGITAKMLRHYDDIGLLPAKRASLDNDYRYYEEGQFASARLIARLRKADMPLAEIAKVQDRLASGADTADLLRAHLSLLSQRQSALDACVMECNALISSNLKEVKMDYKVKVENVGAQKVVSVRKEMALTQMGEVLGELFKVAGKRCAGPPFTIYHDPEFMGEGVTDMEVALPVFVGDDAKVLPSIKAVTTIHKGPYNELGQAYKAVMDYIKENHLEFAGPPREAYLTEPDAKGGPETKIIVPVK